MSVDCPSARASAARVSRASASRVEDQHDAAVSQIGRARNSVDAHERIGDRAHDDFALSEMRSTARPTAPKRRCRSRRHGSGRGGRCRGRRGAPGGRSAGRRRDRRSIRCVRRAAHRTSATSMTSRTACCGTANVCVPTRPMSASVIASVSGSSMVKRVPPPGSVPRRMVPDSCSTVDLTTAMPTPRPLARSASSLVENPGAHRSARSAAASGVPEGTGRPAARACAATASASIPRPSSLASIVTISPAVDALSVMVPSGRLPAAMRSAAARCRG